jgi:DNA processing protein
MGTRGDGSMQPRLPLDPPRRGHSLTEAQRRDWLRLTRTEGIGPRTFRSLVNRFGGARQALDALPALTAEKLGRRVVPASEAAIDREVAAADAMGARFVAMGEPDYPRMLTEIADPPPVLAMLGKPSLAALPVAAMIGSRNASAGGLRMAERLAAGLGQQGFTIASGLARGIDAAAHKASLATGTIAVVAGGLDKLSPPEHEALFAAIATNGLVISEMPFGWVPRGRDFPRRNRLVSGLSLGVVVVEAARQSGSLITARFALEQNREVFAVPGSPLDPRAEGPNHLIRQGATLVMDAEDIAAVLRPLIGREPQDHAGISEDVAPEGGDPLWDELDLFGEGFKPPETPHEPPGGFSERAPERMAESLPGRLLQLLSQAPSSPDDLVVLAPATAREVSAALLALELDGRVERRAGGAVALVPRG